VIRFTSLTKLIKLAASRSGTSRRLFENAKGRKSDLTPEIAQNVFAVLALIKAGIGRSAIRRSPPQGVYGPVGLLGRKHLSSAGDT
jgi:hypothetical protein